MNVIPSFLVRRSDLENILWIALCIYIQRSFLRVSILSLYWVSGINFLISQYAEKRSRQLHIADISLVCIKRRVIEQLARNINSYRWSTSHVQLSLFLCTWSTEEIMVPNGCTDEIWPYLRDRRNLFPPMGENLQTVA